MIKTVHSAYYLPSEKFLQRSSKPQARLRGTSQEGEGRSKEVAKKERSRGEEMGRGKKGQGMRQG